MKALTSSPNQEHRSTQFRMALSPAFSLTVLVHSVATPYVSRLPTARISTTPTFRLLPRAPDLEQPSSRAKSLVTSEAPEAVQLRIYISSTTQVAAQRAIRTHLSNQLTGVKARLHQQRLRQQFLCRPPPPNSSLASQCDLNRLNQFRGHHF